MLVERAAAGQVGSMCDAILVCWSLVCFGNSVHNLLPTVCVIQIIFVKLREYITRQCAAWEPTELTERNSVMNSAYHCNTIVGKMKCVLNIVNGLLQAPDRFKLWNINNAADIYICMYKQNDRIWFDMIWYAYYDIYDIITSYIIWYDVIHGVHSAHGIQASEDLLDLQWSRNLFCFYINSATDKKIENRTYLSHVQGFAKAPSIQSYPQTSVPKINPV